MAVTMKNKYPNLSAVTLESFDAAEGTHEFSESYKERKMKMLENLREESRNAEMNKRKNGRKWIAAAAAAVLLMAMPAAANAATGGRLFDASVFAGIWGRGESANIAEHTEISDAANSGTIEITFPEREYVELSEEKTEKLLGGQSFEPLEVLLGDTEMNILSVTHDDKIFVVSYTLEREGGVDMLNYSQLDNESKGAYFSNSAMMSYNFSSCGGFTYVDLEASTPEKLCCIDYIIMGAANGHRNSILLNVYEYEPTFGDYARGNGKRRLTFMQDIPCGAGLEQTEFISECGSEIRLSPIGMRLDRIISDVVPEEWSLDPYAAYYVAITYKDGTEYVLEQHGYGELVQCDKEIYNLAYSRGELYDGMIYVFNRLVDPEDIDFITVNETTYRLG